MRKLRRALVAVPMLAMAGYVQAASILPSDIDQQFADAKADMVKIFGLAMILVLALVAWRYIKRAAS